jgi:uncharacterized protein (DUF427 family)
MMFADPSIFEPIDRRIRLRLGDEIIADSVRVMMLIAPGKHPVYYLHRDDFTDGALEVLGPAVSAFDHDANGHGPAPDYVAVDWKAVRWFEEEEEVLRHPRNPYVRVDCLPSTRKVEVMLADEVVAETTRSVLLFETGMLTRQYIPLADVRPGILRPSELRTYCPYKGWASYNHVELGGQLFENIVWYYPEPFDECLKIKGLVSFYNEKVDQVMVGREPATNRFPIRVLA